MTDDDIHTWKLTSEGFEDLLDGSEHDDEALFLLRCMQSAEALELPYRTEDELGDLLDWYRQVQTDFMLIEMVLRGDIYIVEMEDTERGIVRFSGPSQNLDELPSLDT